MMQGKDMAAQVLVAFKGHLESALTPIRRQVSELLARIENLPTPKDGAPGRDGRDGLSGERGLQGEKGLDGLHGKDGANGKDGRDGVDGSAGPMGERGPQGEKGEPGERGPAGPSGEKGDKGEAGEKGADGLNGKDGRDGIDGKDGAAGLNGKDGADGLNGKDGAPGRDGSDGRHGMDGKSISLDDVRPMLEAELAKWELDFERRAQNVLQRSVDRIPRPIDGRDGVDGKDGRDGFSVEDLKFFKKEDGRTLVVRFERGEHVKEQEIRFDVPIFRGSYKAGETYQTGDCVNWGGNMWVAKQDAPGRPTDGPGWQLAVRRGADAK